MFRKGSPQASPVGSPTRSVDVRRSRSMKKAPRRPQSTGSSLVLSRLQSGRSIRIGQDNALSVMSSGRSLQHINLLNNENTGQRPPKEAKKQESKSIHGVVDKSVTKHPSDEHSDEEEKFEHSLSEETLDPSKDKVVIGFTCTVSAPELPPKYNQCCGCGDGQLLQCFQHHQNDSMSSSKPSLFL